MKYPGWDDGKAENGKTEHKGSAVDSSSRCLHFAQERGVKCSILSKNLTAWNRPTNVTFSLYGNFLKNNLGKI